MKKMYKIPKPDEIEKKYMDKLRRKCKGILCYRYELHLNYNIMRVYITLTLSSGEKTKKILKNRIRHISIIGVAEGRKCGQMYDIGIPSKNAKYFME